MPEELAVAESVTSTDVSVAVDPALLNRPQRPEEGASNGDELLKHKLGLANQHAKKAKADSRIRRQSPRTPTSPSGTPGGGRALQGVWSDFG